jgi:hypothetical protein
MPSQPDVGGKHKPKREIAHERNIDKHRDQREKGNNERNYVHAENVENPDSRHAHIASLPKASREQRLRAFSESQSKTGN